MISAAANTHSGREAENAYWTALTIEASELGGVSQSTSKVQEHHYKAATARALSFGYWEYATLYREYYAYCGQEDRPNPFRQLSFKEDRNSKSKRAPFETDWVRERFMIPGLFDTVNAEARHILLALIETGARPSEIYNLTTDNG